MKFSFARTGLLSAVIISSSICSEAWAQTAPTVSTTAVSSITGTSANSGGNVTSDGGASVTARGVCWSTPANPTTADTKTTDGTGTGSFTSIMAGLSVGTSYHVRAYATNSVGTSYGDDVKFTTGKWNANLITNPGAETSDLSGWTIVLNGGNNWTAIGSIVRSGSYSFGTSSSWCTRYQLIDLVAAGLTTTELDAQRGITFSEWIRSRPDCGAQYYVGFEILNGSQQVIDSWYHGSQISPITLSAATNWFEETHTFSDYGTGLRYLKILDGGKDTNFWGGVYGAHFDDSSVILDSTTAPMVTTTAVSNISATTASSGGNVTADGGAGVTARGVCWNTGGTPTTADGKTTDSTGTGAFTSSLTGLTANTTYYVRAYATNSVGTSYGTQVSFTTDTTPTVTMTALSSITVTTASSGGNVTSDGNATVTARGVCWSTSANPATADSKTTDGAGTGIFTSSITGLSPGTTYHVRAYATNSVGTSYGSDVEFTSSTTTPTVTTTTVSSIITIAANSGGNVTSDGGASVTARGVCWNTTGNPTTADDKTTDGTGTGSFTSNLAGLYDSTMYYVRAYATNSAGTAYGSIVNFSTPGLANNAPPTTDSPTDQVVVNDDGTADLNNDDASVNFDGFTPGTPVQLETNANEDLVVTVGDDADPELVVTFGGAGADANIDLSRDDQGNPSIQYTDASGTDITLILREFPLGVNSHINLSGGGQITGDITNNSDSARNVSLQCTGNIGRVAFTVTYNQVAAGAGLSKSVTTVKGQLTSTDSVTVSADDLELEAVVAVALVYRDTDYIGGSESDLRLLWLNEAAGEYGLAGTNDRGISASTGILGDYGVDTTAKTVWAQVSQLGTFAVGDITKDAPTNPDTDSGDNDDVLADQPDDISAEQIPTCGAGLVPSCGVGMLNWLVMVSGMAALKRRR